MPALSELPVPETRSLADIPVPDTGLGTATPEQRDADAFQATAGEFRKGLRASVNGLGASLHGALAGPADAMGLTDFAASRFKDAAEYAAFSDAVAPRVRDYRTIKDLQDAVDFVAGASGQGIGSTVPALAGGALGARFGGLRGATVGAGLSSFVPETGESILTTKDEAASPQKKLAVGVGKGAINAVLDVAGLAVPGGAVAKGLRAAAPKALSTIGKSTLAEGVTEGAQEVVGQQAHRIINPERSTTEDVPQAINAALTGAVGGAAFGGAGAGAAKLAGVAAGAADKAGSLRKIPEDRSQTVDEVKRALGTRERPGPLDPDPTNLPDDPDQMAAAFDKHDASLDEQLRRDWDRVKDKPEFKQHEGWDKSPEAREAFHEALGGNHTEEVDKPFATKALEGIKKFVDRLRPAAQPGAKASERRTAMDVFVMDELERHLPEHMRAALSPAQKIELAEAVKTYAMHTAGVKDEQPGPGKPETALQLKSLQHAEAPDVDAVTTEGPRDALRAVPHGLMDILGENLWPLISTVQKNLGKAGTKLVKPLTKKDVQTAERRRGERMTRLEDVVLSNLRSQHLPDKATRATVVREMTQKLQKRINEGLTAENAAQFKSDMDFAFGENADAVFDAFDAQRDDITRGYEDLGDNLEPRKDESVAQRLARNEQFRVTEEDENLGDAPVTEPEPNPTGEQASPAEERHPYRDVRLGVPMELAAAKRLVSDMKQEPNFDERQIKLRPVPEINELGELTGRVSIVAEDSEAQVGFDADSLERIREKHHKGGFENSVISMVRKDPENAARNKTHAVSIPNLVAETIRTTKRRGDGADYVRDIVMEGLGRVMSDPDFVRWAPSTAGESIHQKAPELSGAPDPFKEYGDRRPASEGNHPSLGIGKISFPDDMFVANVNGTDYFWSDVKEAKGSVDAEELAVQRLTRDVVERARLADKLLPREEISDKVKDRMQGNLDEALAEDNKYLARRIETAMEELEAEVARREKYGDSPFFDMNREQGTTVDQATIADEKRGEGESRRYSEADTNLGVGQERRGPAVDSDPRATAVANRRLFHPTRSERKAAAASPSVAPVTPLKTQAMRDKYTTEGGSGNMWELLMPQDVVDQLVMKGNSDEAIVAEFKKAQVSHPKLPGAAKVREMIATSRKDPQVVVRKVLSIEQERKFRSWLEKNPGKTAQDWLDAGEPKFGRGKVVDLGEIKSNKLKARALQLMSNMLPEDLDVLMNDRLGGIGEVKDLPSSLRKDFRDWVKETYGPVEGETKQAAENLQETQREFLESVINDEDGIYTTNQQAMAVRLLAGKPIGPVKLSEVRVGPEKITPEQEKMVRDEVARLLGPRAKVLFQELDTAGSFANMSGVEVLTTSIHALDPLGVGRHEAFHAIFARLSATNPEAANVLSNAARSPTVVAQLRKLLADHPRALAQLKDHEERAAYMYEFWAADQLKVGARTQTLFEKARAMFGQALHAIFGIGNDPATARKAEDLLLAFHEGRLADRSAAGEAISKVLPRDELAGTWSDRLGDWANRVWSTADGYVRDMKLPAFTDKADQFFNPGEGKAGMLQTKIPTMHRFMNRYATAVKGLDEAAQRRVLESLQQQKRLTQNEAEASAARALRGLLDDVLTYMVGKGVKEVLWDEEAKQYYEKSLGQLEHYFPRMFDREAVVARREELVALLKKYDVAHPEAVVDNLADPQKAAPKGTAGLTFYEPHTMERKLKVPDAELAPFMKKDLGSIMYDYLNYATRRAEYAERFGNQGQAIEKAIEQGIEQGATADQVLQFRRYVAAMDGSLGNKIDPKLRKLMGGVLTYQNFRLLPLALFSSLIDPIGLVVRGAPVADGFKAFARGIRELVSTNEDEARQFAKVVGAVTDASEEHMVADMYGQNYGAAWQKWLNQKLFKLNGMESWNNSMRTAAAAAAREFIIKHATKPGEHSARWLSELGIKADDVRVDSNGGMDLTPAVVDAVNKWVDGAVLRPHAAIRPIWGSDPHFMLVMHLKQFSYAFQKTINERVIHEAMNGNYRPIMFLGSYVPFIIASDMLRGVITPGGGDDKRLEKWGVADWLMHGVSRAGITGPGQYALDGAMDLRHGKLALGAIGGPTAQQVFDMAHAASGAPGSDLRTEAYRALPFVPAVFPGKIRLGE